MNIDILLEMTTLLLSIVAFIYSYSTTRENYFQKLRTFEQREYFSKELDREKNEITEDINGIGGKINAMETRLTLIEYQLLELKTVLNKLKNHD